MRRGFSAVLSLIIAGFSSGSFASSAFAAGVVKTTLSGSPSGFSGQAGAASQTGSASSLAPASLAPVQLPQLPVSPNDAPANFSIAPTFTNAQGVGPVRADGGASSPSSGLIEIHRDADGAAGVSTILSPDSLRAAGSVIPANSAPAVGGERRGPEKFFSGDESGASTAPGADGADKKKQARQGPRAGLKKLAAKGLGADRLDAAFDGADLKPKNESAQVNGANAQAPQVSRMAGLQRSREMGDSAFAGWGKPRFGEPGFERSPPVLEGVKPLAEYKAPGDLNRSRGAFLAVHGLLLTAAAGALILAFGAVPVAAAAVVVSADLSWQLRREPKDDLARAFGLTMWGAPARAFDAYLKASLANLIARLGLSSSQAPALTVTNLLGSMGASATAAELSPNARLTVGEGFAERPAEETTAVLAHELGHMVHKDFGALRLLRNRSGLYFAMGALSKVFVLSTAAWAAAAWFGAPAVASITIFGLIGAAFLAQNNWIASRFVQMRRAIWTHREARNKALRARHGISLPSLDSLFIVGAFFYALASLGLDHGAIADVHGNAMITALAAFPLALAGLLAGIAVSRVEEYRADHFAGWLTDPEWMAAHLDERHKIANDPRNGPRNASRLYWSLMATHPTDAARAAKLRSK